MIYQLYPNSNFQCEPFSKYYSTLCLDCLDNKYIPQLKMEYSGMIYLWKNHIDNDDWIGFTSHRQRNKSSFILDENNISKVLSLLDKYDILCFNTIELDYSISEQAEFYHPEINNNIKYLFNDIYKEKIPDSFYINSSACFANYWIMSKINFNNFMNWSYKKVLHMIRISTIKPYFSVGEHTNNTGYIIERLFIIWYLMFNKQIYNLMNASES